MWNSFGANSFSIDPRIKESISGKECPFFDKLFDLDGPGIPHP